MTERTVRSVAKEIAGCFYEESQRTPGFRRMFPTFQAFMRGQQHMPDGSIKLYRPGWMHFVDTARKRMAQMIGDKATGDHLKWAMFNSLIEDRKRIYQAGLLNPKNVKDLPQGVLGRRLDA